jgi:O-antigen/teichoic acid export membrane protein
MRRDIATAYFVTAARIVSWAGISAIVYRRLGRGGFAMLTLVRSTIGLLSYTSLGLAPAMVKRLAEAARPLPARPLEIEPLLQSNVLPYAGPALQKEPTNALGRVYASGELLASWAACLAVALGSLYAMTCPSIHEIPTHLKEQTQALGGLMALALAFRLVSEPAASFMQVRGRIALDNLLLGTCEMLWLAAVAVWFRVTRPELYVVGLAMALCSGLLLLARQQAVSRIAPDALDLNRSADPGMMGNLLSFGLGIVVAQAADFLSAPTDYILINRLIDPTAVAIYAPAVQLDAGLLLMVTALAGVLFPHAAIAHVAGDAALVRRYYIRGTLFSLMALFAAALLVWAVSGPLLRVWLGSPQPLTQAILPLVLIHTVVGGSSAVGRSILLAMGKVRPFTASVLLAAFANVVLSFVFVRYFHLGLRGIIYGTIIAVTARCALWMPWYVLRSLAAAESARGE